MAELLLRHVVSEVSWQARKRIQLHLILLSANFDGWDPELARLVVEFHDFMAHELFIEPKFDESIDQVQADEHSSGSRVVECFHCFLSGRRAVSSEVDVLAAKGANNLPAVDSVAQTHVG